MKPKNKTLQEERLAICTPCKSNSTSGVINKHSKCELCGCYLQVKSNNQTSSCPANKWKK